MKERKAKKIAHIIKKYSLKEDLNDIDKDMLREWILEDEANIDTLNNIFKGDSIDYILELDSYKICNRISSQVNKRIRLLDTKRRVRRNWLAVSFSAAIIAISFILIETSRVDGPIEMQTKIAQVGDDEIVLITAEGEVVNVENIDKNISHGITIDKSTNTIRITKVDSGSIIKNPSRENRIKVPVKKEINVILADGTAVWLNPGSEMVFPSSFDGKTREVTLIGEAYFDVAKDISKPFIVRTKVLDIEVTGTQFMVSSYGDNEIYKVMLAEGSVKVNSNVTNYKTKLKPGKGVEFNTTDLSCREVDVDLDYIYSIKKGEFVFKGETLKEITDNLKYWYGIEFYFEQAAVKDLKFYLESSKYEDLENVLKLLKATNEIDYKIIANTVIIKLIEPMNR